MRGGLAHHNVQVAAVLRAYDRAIAEGDHELAKKIRNANPDLEAQLSDRESHAAPSL